MYELIEILGQNKESAAQAVGQLPLWASMTIGIASAGVLTAIINFWPNFKKSKADSNKSESEGEKAEAEAADIIQKAAGELVQQIQRAAAEAAEQAAAANLVLLKQNEEMAEQIAEMKHDINDLRHGIELLTQQLKDNGINPVYPPMPPSL